MFNKIAIGVVALMAVPFFASAASISNIKFDNNQTTASCTAGQTVNVTFRVVVPAGEVAELGQTDVLGDNLAPSLPFDLGGSNGLEEGSHDVATSVVCPQNTGYYTVELRTAGLYGGLNAVNINDGVTSQNSFNNALRVVANGSTVGGTETSVIAQLTAQVQSLIAQVSCSATGGIWTGTACTPKPVPVTSSACVALAEKLVGAQYGVKNTPNVSLQGFLLADNPNSIPLIRDGKASFGFWGNETQGAVTAYKSKFSCQ